MVSWSERGLTFGSVAEAYERYRLGYPDELVDRVLAHARRPVRTAVEIGAGTGKATRVFAAAGIAVTALEPDADMLAQLTANVRGQVTPVLSTFEEADLSGPVDLVYAAAALHWTDPATRWERIARVLSSGGVVASFGGPRHIADPELRERVRQLREPYVPEDDVHSPLRGRDDGPAPDGQLQWPGTDMRDSPCLTDVVQVVLDRRLHLSAEHLIGHLATVSAYLLLDADARAEVLARIRSVLPEQVEIIADVTLHLARRT